jgi:hypothetical protein
MTPEMPCRGRRNGLPRHEIESSRYHHRPLQNQRTYGLAERTKERKRNLKGPWSPRIPAPLYPELCTLRLLSHEPAKERHPL